MQTSQQNNKRIAKNTLLLYVRMFFIMVVGLYTSRVVLNSLGVEDYGIYNVVGGVISMFSIVSTSLSSAISRFITYELGKGITDKLQKIFASAITIQILLSLFVILLVETIGVWFLNTKMNIPTERISAANWVLQFSMITFVVNLISVPYNATIIAHEKMSAFAYISIFEVVGKLIIAYLITVSPIDRLVFYGLLMCFVALVVRFVYGSYCKRHFSECTYTFCWDRILLKKMFSFAGWQFFGSGSYILMTQGVNLLLNFYFGPIVNAARGIAVQVESVVQQFVNNFTTAINPQIIKSYAAEEKNYMFQLMYAGAKYSYFLMLFLAIPIIIETEPILHLWLGNIPNHTVSFLRIILITQLLYTLSNTMMTAMIATGKIKKYQIIVGGTGMLVFPLAWISFKLGFQPETAFFIQFFIFVIQLISRMILLRSMIGFSIKGFIYNVILRALMVTLVSFSIPLVIDLLYSREGLTHMLFVCVASVITTLVAIYLCGLTSKERIFIVTKIKSISK